MPLTPKEDDIRRSGGIVAVGRREFAPRSTATPRIEWPDPERARRMTTTEQILWAHRVDKHAEVMPGATLKVYADLLPASDGTAPFAIHTFNLITGGRLDRSAPGGDRQRSLRLHRPGRRRQADRHRPRVRPRCTASASRTTRRRATASSTSTFRSRGWSRPGSSFPAPIRTAAPTAPTPPSASASDRRRSASDGPPGYIYITLAKARRVVFSGSLQPWVSGKDIVLDLLRRWGTGQSEGMSVELVDANQQLPMAYRNTIANMMAEAEAQNGIFAPDDITAAWYRAKGIGDLPYPTIAPGARRRLRRRRDGEPRDVVPMIARPFSPGNASAAEDVARERMTFDKAMIGSVHQRQLRRSADRGAGDQSGASARAPAGRRKSW